jgi:acyl-CoA synthetase (AMP-forming)/AMP-acid ligase II
LDTLTGAIDNRPAPSIPQVWSTFYDIRRYGGLQIFLRAVLTGSSLVLSSAQELVGDFLIRAGACGVTHISGTPSHWRKALMSPAANSIDPQYIRLSGEIADQAILDHLKAAYPRAVITHAFASTEAGVAFDVADGRSGFPASLIGADADVEMKVVDKSLHVRSSRIGLRYLNDQARPLVDRDGFVDTGDLVELRGDRYHFIGRLDGVINIGGLKVHPEEIEGVINRHPDVQMSLVRAKRNPITGAVVVAEVVLKSSPGSRYKDIHQLRRELLGFCHNELQTHKVPAVIKFVPALAISETGKLVRHYA